MHEDHSQCGKIKKKKPNTSHQWKITVIYLLSLKQTFPYVPNGG